MVLQNREILLMAGVGVSLGLAATVLDATAFVPTDGPDQSQSDADLFAIEQAALEAEFYANLGELRRLENEAGSPAQQWAEGVLASGQPLTMREMTTLSQIVNGEPGQVNGYPGYSGSSYASEAASSQPRPIPAPQAGLSSRPIARSQSTSGARLGSSEQLSLDHGPVGADQGGSSLHNNAGAIDVRTGQYYAPAGTGYVNTQNGTYYTPSGPNGVVDTRTGAFIPTAP